MQNIKAQNALTLVLSHPMGEGTAGGRCSLLQQLFGNHSAVIFQKDGGAFSLSHRMGEGRGEGQVFVGASEP